MIALDTNVLVRYIVRDDEAQAHLAEAAMNAPCFISHTVLLEAAWVLTSRYGLSDRDLAATIRDLLSLPTVTVTESEWMEWAVTRFELGADFADMVHLVASGGADRFITFDRKLVSAAGDVGPLPVTVLGR